MISMSNLQKNMYYIAITRTLFLLFLKHRSMGRKRLGA